LQKATPRFLCFRVLVVRVAWVECFCSNTWNWQLPSTFKGRIQLERRPDDPPPFIICSNTSYSLLAKAEFDENPMFLECERYHHIFSCGIVAVTFNIFLFCEGGGISRNCYSHIKGTNYIL
jgi:hypothetical protein